MIFRIARVTLEIDTLYIVQQRWFFWFWVQPHNTYIELVRPMPNLRKRHYEPIPYHHIQFASVAEAAAAIDACRKRLNMFHPSQLKHEETR